MWFPIYAMRGIDSCISIAKFITMFTMFPFVTVYVNIEKWLKKLDLSKMKEQMQLQATNLFVD